MRPDEEMWSTWKPGDLVQLSDGSLAVVRGGPYNATKALAEFDSSMALQRKRIQAMDGKLHVAKLSRRTASAGMRTTLVSAIDVQRLLPPRRGLVLKRNGWEASIDGQCGPLSVAVEFRCGEETIHAEYIRPAGGGGFRWSEDVRAYLSDALQLEAAHWIEREFGHGL